MNEMSQAFEKAKEDLKRFFAKIRRANAKAKEQAPLTREQRKKRRKRLARLQKRGDS